MGGFADPRAATATIVGGIGGVELYEGPYEIDGRLVALPKALPGVAEYVTAARAEANANELRPRLVQDLDISPGSFAFQTNATLVMDFRAAVGSAITEAIVGVETFANHFVGRHFAEHPTFEFGEKVYTTAKEIYDEKLNDRVGKIVPAILGMDSRTSEPWWSKFRILQSLSGLKRHGVYDAVKKNGLVDEKPLIQRYIDGEYRGAARMMLDVFESVSPGWIPAERLRALPPAP